jgi:ATP/maltotriose-dependent transcriptional regulator MalT
VNQRYEAGRIFQEALAVFRQSGDRSGEALAADMLGRMAAFACQFDKARVYFEQALALCQAMGQTRRMADTQRHLADLALSLGAYSEAEELLTAVWQTYTAIQDRRSAGTTLTRLALLHHYQGDDKAAQERAETALTIAEEVASPMLHGYALTCLGQALRGQEQWEKSAAVYRKAISVWQELGMTGLQAEARAALAAVFYYATGRLDDAWPLLEPALAYLAEWPQPDCEAPGDFYLDCMILLQARGDKRADLLLQQAVQMLHQQAASIADAQTRIAFLEGIAAHQHLLALSARARTARTVGV